jgi:hypothetical protein
VSALALPLAEFQSWMQAVLVHPEGAAIALRAPEASRFVAPEDAASVVRERGDLAVAERLQIYAGMYPLRMRDALRSDYPALAELLGGPGFEKLVADYVAVHPSGSFTLARLGDHLPEFLAGWGSPRRRGLRTDVARLEQAGAQVFDAEESAPLDPATLQTLPAQEWPSVRLRPAPAFRLVKVRPGAADVLDAVLEGNPPQARAGRGHVEVAFYRKDFVVRRRTLGLAAGRLLRVLSEGVPLGEAVGRASRAPGANRPSPAEVAAWIPEWLQLGFFARVEAGASPSRA